MVSAARKRIFFIFCIILIICIFLRIIIFNGALLAETNDYRRQASLPVLVKVYYEALCPDSKHFITKQLLPAYERAAPILNVQLVPYGKAKTHTNSDGTYRFDCQHGQLECTANIYHACAIEAIEDLKTEIDVVACMIRDNINSKEAVHKCAKEYNIENIDLIQKCFDSLHGSELLKLNGDETNALRPPVSFIPTITLDGFQGKQAAILKNLLAEVCKIARGTHKADEICRDV